MVGLASLPWSSKRRTWTVSAVFCFCCFRSVRIRCSLMGSFGVFCLEDFEGLERFFALVLIPMFRVCMVVLLVLVVVVVVVVVEVILI